MRTVGVLASVAFLAVALTVGGCATVAITPPVSPTAGEDAAWAQAFVDGTWTNTGLPDSERPALPLGEIDPDQQSWGETTSSCFSANGLYSYSYSGGSDGITLLDDDSQPLDDDDDQLAMYRCIAEHPPAPSAFGALTSTETEYLARYWRQWTVPCLLAHGNDPGAMPGDDDLFSDGQRMWDPYFSVLSRERRDRGGWQDADEAEWQRRLAGFARECGPEAGALQGVLGG